MQEATRPTTPIVIYASKPYHIKEKRFLPTSTCGCRKDRLFLASVDEEVREGLLTTEEATRLKEGRQL